MASIPENTGTTVRAIDERVRETSVNGFRPHLGASVLGRDCDRALWYQFRWALKPEFSGRVLRLFARGQEEEKVFTRLLRSAGVEVIEIDPNTGRQYEFSAVGGHAGGSMDGAGRGLFEAPKTWHVLEFKTHNDKSFRALKKNGVEKSKPEHFAQMQLYMHWSGMERAYYLAVNKNDDTLYGERIRHDSAVAVKLIARAERIITSPTPPPGVSDDPEWYQCRFCDFRSICHGEALPEIHCRTCVHSTPEIDGDARWTCARRHRDLDDKTQKQGCDEHLYIPDFIRHAQQIDAGFQGECWIEYQTPDGRTFINGPGEIHYTSAELRACAPESIGDEAVRTLKKTSERG